MVEVVWHGHACFELKGEKTTIVIDPFTGIGLPEPRAEANLVLCTHSHRDHNHVTPVLKLGGTVLEGYVGPYIYFQGVPVQGIATFHDDTEGSQRGRNSVYTLQLDGVAFCHLGDLGHDLTDKQIGWIGAVDVLFVPVGGGPTIGPEMASKIAARLNPKIIVPMHYGLSVGEGLLSRLNKVDVFLKDKKNVQRLSGRAFSVTKETLPQEQTVTVPSLE